MGAATTEHLNGLGRNCWVSDHFWLSVAGKGKALLFVGKKEHRKRDIKPGLKKKK